MYGVTQLYPVNLLIVYHLDCWLRVFLVVSCCFFQFVYHSSKQLDLYDETFRQLVDSVLEGYNGELTPQT